MTTEQTPTTTHPREHARQALARICVAARAGAVDALGDHAAIDEAKAILDDALDVLALEAMTLPAGPVHLMVRTTADAFDMRAMADRVTGWLTANGHDGSAVWLLKPDESVDLLPPAVLTVGSDGVESIRVTCDKCGVAEYSAASFDLVDGQPDQVMLPAHSCERPLQFLAGPDVVDLVTREGYSAMRRGVSSHLRDQAVAVDEAAAAEAQRMVTT